MVMLNSSNRYPHALSSYDHSVQRVSPKSENGTVLSAPLAMAVALLCGNFLTATVVALQSRYASGLQAMDGMLITRCVRCTGGGDLME